MKRKNLIISTLFFLAFSNISIGIFAQSCFFDVERIDDTSIKITASGNTVNSTNTGRYFGFLNSDLFTVFPNSNVPTLSNNSLMVNGVPAQFGCCNDQGSTGFGLSGNVTGNLAARGEITLTWANGVITNDLTANLNIFHQIDNPGNFICTTSGLTGPPVPPVPTLGQWGLIILSLLMMSLVMAFSIAPKLATTTGQQIPQFSLNNLPFDLNQYAKMWAGTVVSMLAIFTIAIQGFGYELTSADPIGAVVSSFLVAYLVFLAKNEDKK